MNSNQSERIALLNSGGVQFLPPPPAELLRGAVSAESFQIEVVDNLEHLIRLRQEWNALAGRFETPLLRHEWFEACAKAFCPPERLHVIVLRKGNAVRAIVPAVLVNRIGMEQFEILGAAHLFEPTGILFTDEAALDSGVAALLGNGKPVILHRFPADLNPGPITHHEARERRIVIESWNASPWIPIVLPWSEYEATLTSKSRTGIRRLTRRLEKQGKIELVLYTGDTEAFRAALEDAFRIEASGWKGKRGTAILARHRLRRFFTEFMTSAAREGWARVFLLTLAGEGIAAIVALEYASRLWLLKVGYDESWRAFAPGIVLHQKAIEWAFDRGLRGFEFLGSAEPFIESRWLSRRHWYRTYRIALKTPRGMAWMAGEAGRVLLKRARDRMAKVADRKWRKESIDGSQHV